MLGGHLKVWAISVKKKKNRRTARWTGEKKHPSQWVCCLLWPTSHICHLSLQFWCSCELKKKRIEKQYLPQQTKISILFCVQILLLLNPVQPVTCLCFGNNIQKLWKRCFSEFYRSDAAVSRAEFMTSGHSLVSSFLSQPIIYHVRKGKQAVS